MQVKSLFFEASPLRNSLILESPRQVNGLKSIWEWMQCLIRTFPHFLQGIAKYRITWEQNARRQSTNELCWEQSVEGKTVEWASSANPVSLIPPPPVGNRARRALLLMRMDRDNPRFSVCCETMMDRDPLWSKRQSHIPVKRWKGYLMHSQSDMGFTWLVSTTRLWWLVLT